MRLFGKTTPRQKEIRRSKAERRPAWWRRLNDQVSVRPLVMLVTSALAAALIINLGGEILAVRVGQRIPRAMTSRVTFRIADEQRTQVMRMRARDNADTYYTLDTSLLLDIRNRLTNALRIAREQAADPEKVRQQAAAIQVQLDDEGLAELVRLANLADSTLYQQAVDRAMRTLRRQPLVEAEDLANRRTGEAAVLVDEEQGTERPISVLRLLFANDSGHVGQVADVTAADFPLPLRTSMTLTLVGLLAGDPAAGAKPLFRYDATRSAQAAQRAEDAVPLQHIEYAVGARLADAGEITREELDLLHHEHEEFRRFSVADEPTHRSLQRAALARGFLCFVLIIGLGGYVILHYGHTLGVARRRSATTLILLLILVLTRWIYLQTGNAHVAVGAQAFASALLAITAFRGVANVTSGMLALVLALNTRQDVSFVLVLISVSLVMLFGLQDVRNRGRIISVGFLAAVVATFATALAGLVNGQDAWFVLRGAATWAGVTTLAAAFLIEGILPTIERLFGVTTNMTLLEWCDPNQPVLRMLAAESPGTYNHSLLVGNLADAAAEAIGANGLLARTGAYYHDIGKINKPMYFVENQAMDVGNRHERLSPAMSHLIIIGHVKDGIEMAKEYKLPTRLHPFIPEHHGTCVVEYFYHAASQARKPGDPEVSHEQFRYPGPKPRSRETAIVMLCDGVEGAVRAMPEPTPGRIRDTVDRIIQKRLIDGQFDDCDLTFRELHIIRESLVKSLNSIYHGRIAYPSDEKSSDKAKAPKPDDTPAPSPAR